MPCWTVSTSTIDVQKMSSSRLAAALRAEGWTVHDLDGAMRAFEPAGAEVYYQDGTASLSVRRASVASAVAATVVRAYSAQIVREGAAKFGLRVKADTAKATSRHLTLGR